MITKTKMITKLCCMKCERDVLYCSSCGKNFGISENIICSEIPDGAHYCCDCKFEESTIKTMGCDEE